MNTISPARFDDLTPGREHSFVLEDPIAEFAAHDLSDVHEVIHHVEAAARDGLWSAGFISYEAAPAFDPALTVRIDAAGPRLPLAWFGTYRSRRPAESPRPRTHPAPYRIGEWVPTIAEDAYRTALGVVKDRIEAGDTYQVNLTFRLGTAVEGDLDEYYSDLVLAQRGGYGVHLRIPGYSILSASPEEFFHTSNGRIRVTPMKGTIRRGRWPEEDASLAEELAGSAKDRAENLIIVDLLRNDVGRIARFGSVEVTELFAPERYETVWQLTSTIEADLRPDVGLSQTLDALFPSGSVTGAPKPSTMAIIAAVESDPRGLYCGAIGYVSPAEIGEAHFNVAIRTVVIDHRTGRAEYGTGGGVTWDSTADGEYAEALLKTELLTRSAPDFGLIETMRWEDGRFLLLDDHLDRIGRSAEYFGFRFERSSIAAALSEAASPDQSARRVRLRLARTGQSSVEWLEPLDQPFVPGPDAAGYSAAPLVLGVATEPIDPTDRMLFHKTTERSRYERALASAPRGDDVVLVDPTGHVTETATANLAVLIDGEWRTPPLSSGCLPGVLRAVELERGRLVERRIPLDELRVADDIAVLNSVRGWRRAVLASIDDTISVP